LYNLGRAVQGPPGAAGDPAPEPAFIAGQPYRSVMSGHHDGPELTVLEPRLVPLGGTRAITVRRTLPHRQVRTIGPWCFVDHYGPHTGTGMDVPPHPHTGLQTVSWLLAGEVEHRDSAAHVATVRPGELNLMTSGRGIAHSEVSLPSQPVLHGVQLWLALPDEHRHQQPHFEQHRSLPQWHSDGVATTLVVGELAGSTSPALTYSPVVGAHLRLAAGAGTAVPVDPGFEHAVLVLDGSVDVAGCTPGVGALVWLGLGRRQLGLRSVGGGQVLLLGGARFDEELLMWWNFVGRSHEEILAFRQDWETGATFGEVAGYPGARLPAPSLPSVVLRPRPGRRG